jgi:hypothetical protein
MCADVGNDAAINVVSVCFAELYLTPYPLDSGRYACTQDPLSHGSLTLRCSIASDIMFVNPYVTKNVCRIVC